MSDNEYSQGINYFPGHMAKALKRIKETVSAADAAILVVDSRAPWSSFPAGLEKLVANKAKVVLFSKPDLADPKRTAEFMDFYRSMGYQAFEADLKNPSATKTIKKALEQIRTPKDQKFLKLGFNLPPVKCLILGIPNVGKSTLINDLGGKNRAQTENVPGKTKRTSLFRATDRLWLFDTPGILEPKVHDKDAMAVLALLGSVKDTVLPHEALCAKGLALLQKFYPDAFQKRYGIPQDPNPEKALLDLCKARNFLLSQDRYDVDRAIRTVLLEIRDGSLGRLTLDERPDQA